GSPAEKAGVRLADVILAVGDDPVGSLSEYRSLLRTYTPDDEVELRLLRGTREHRGSVRLAELPPNYGLRYGERLLGLSLADSRAG
ncbi:hypothetical protein DF186_19285, partial [Enterococcus hirae]